MDFGYRNLAWSDRSLTLHTVETERRHETEKVRGSRFIATVVPLEMASDVSADVSSHLRRIASELKGANHHVFAWRAGPTASLSRYVDDGEPHGSAGRPVLQQLEGRDLTQTLVVVSRYFGGTKLGVGGLVRAYGGAASEALDLTPTRPWVSLRRMSLTYPYEGAGAVDRVLATHEATVVDAEYGENVSLTISVACERVASLTASVRDATHGRAAIELIDS